MFWPKEVEKLILLSATIGPKDIQELGLHHKRVLYIEAKSPIPPERRPILIDPIVPISYQNMESGTEKMGKLIQEVSRLHTGEKGIIHATYAQASILQKYLPGERYIFHTVHNKKEQFQKFINSPADSGVVLIASGMYEGVDLPDDLGRWQVLAKVPWKSLQDPATRYKAEKDEDWYRWETLKDLIQACGRISRHPEDMGTTYIFDATITKLLTDGKHLLPAWFSAALRFE
jgi:Rad3-related DNA helicase